MITRIPKEKAELRYDGQLSRRGNAIYLEYFLIESEIEDIDELKGMKTYGIEIVKKTDETFADSFAESAAVKNISTSKNKTEKIIQLLSDNYVTPVALDYVLEDIVGI